MAAKLVVTKARGGSKISLIGTSGTELLSSKVFTEPRGKGATLRSLKGLLGEDVVVVDETTSAAPKAMAARATRRPSTEVRGTVGPTPTKPARGRKVAS
jgi:hypothetical protein